MFSSQFVAATKEYNTLEQQVPAPYVRKSFRVDGALKDAKITVCGLGFYRLFLNGQEITKGLLAPYVANPDDILYYDAYDIRELLQEGENVIGILLGNGILNCPGGSVWQFDRAAFRSAPKVAFALELGYADGSSALLEADEGVKVHPSPILMDDYRWGEFYDARLELPGWNAPGFDDSDWKAAIPAVTPKGEPQICRAEPIVVLKKLKPVSVYKGCISKVCCVLKHNIPLTEEERQGYVYDFGENFSGLVRLRIRGEKGQKVCIHTGELADQDGNLDISGMRFQPEAYAHRMVYTLKGEGTEEYAASFTFFGMRYCLVSGITEEQATAELLTYEVMSSDLKRIGNVYCSNEVVNQLQEAVYRADVSNFYYFPLDCPHREKNGWTGDASLSAEQMLFNLTPENSFRVWMDNIRKAQKPDGEIPGIVPTAGWGYSIGKTAWNGPGWDSVLVNLPYYTWLYRGTTTMIEENADCLMRYLRFLAGKRDADGLLELGLWDYVPVRYKMPVTTLVTSSTLIAMDICEKAEKMFTLIGRTLEASFAATFRAELRAAAREMLLGADKVTVLGNNQGAQALGIAYGLFEPGEEPVAVEKLVQLIRASDGHMDCGVLAGRVIFHVLAQHGYAELAYHMIVREDAPSYGHWVVHENCTALFEGFRRTSKVYDGSKNHHFWGDISNWFFRYIAGVKINPHARDVKELEISPVFLEDLTYGGGYHILPSGKVEVRWERAEVTKKVAAEEERVEGIRLTVTIPQGCRGWLKLPDGFCTRDEQDRFLVAAERLTPGVTEYDVVKLY